MKSAIWVLLKQGIVLLFKGTKVHQPTIASMSDRVSWQQRYFLKKVMFGKKVNMNATIIFPSNQYWEAILSCGSCDRPASWCMPQLFSKFEFGQHFNHKYTCICNPTLTQPLFRLEFWNELWYYLIRLEFWNELWYYSAMLGWIAKSSNWPCDFEGVISTFPMINMCSNWR